MQKTLWIQWLRLRNKLKQFVEWMQNNASLLEVAFLIACIYVIATFFGAPHSFWTFFFSIAAFFISQEVFGQLKEITRGMSKK